MPVFRYLTLAFIIASLTSCSVPIKLQKTDGTFPGINKIISEGELTQVLIIHGMGNHSIGYSSHIRHGLIRTLELKINGQSRLYKLQPENIKTGHAYLKIWEYLTGNGKKLRIYELTWSPITRDLKQITFSEDFELDVYRANLNAALKEFVNNYLSDPILYTGKYGKAIRSVVGLAICNIMEDTEEKPFTEIKSCEARNAETDKKALKGGVVIVSHSLGSKVTYDALTDILTSSKNQSLAQDFFGRIRSVFMMSNQISFLELANASSSYEEERFEKNTIGKFLDARAKWLKNIQLDPIHIVAFTDPNDMLSYPLPEGYCSAFGNTLQIQCVNVLVNNNDESIFGQFVNPITAHTGYENNKNVIGMISCGSDREGEKACYKNAGLTE